jgi:CheY-like chemotaxis protein
MEDVRATMAAQKTKWEAVAKILLIDDDEVFVSVMLDALKDSGHSVEFALDGEAGERAFDASPFDAVVCDMLMPRQEGLETIRYMRTAKPNVAVVAISGGLAQESKLDILRMAREIGAHVTLQKPFKPSQLTAAVTQALMGVRALDPV